MSYKIYISIELYFLYIMNINLAILEKFKIKERINFLVLLIGLIVSIFRLNFEFKLKKRLFTKNNYNYILK